ncbi:MAG: hypothetical protein ACFB6S_04065 [Geminicoccaceae bacterium]
MRRGDRLTSRQEGPVSATGDEAYLVSLSDLLGGLLFLFILVLMAFVLNFRVAEDQAAQALHMLTGQNADLETREVKLEDDVAALAVERDALESERDAIREDRDLLQAERDLLQAERDRLDELIERLGTREAKRQDLLERLRSELGRRGVEVRIDASRGILRLPESLLFASADASLSAGGEQALIILAEVLADTLACFGEDGASSTDCAEWQPLVETILIEGHTDEIPIRLPSFPDNWALASARAINTFRALLDAAPELEGFENSSGEALLSVSAYEALRPVAIGIDEDVLRRNRRIDLRFLIAAPSEADLRDIRRQLRDR